MPRESTTSPLPATSTDPTYSNHELPVVSQTQMPHSHQEDLAAAPDTGPQEDIINPSQLQL